MFHRQILSVTVASAALVAGCAGTGQSSPWDPSSASVFVRFSSQPPSTTFSEAGTTETTTSLTSDGVNGGFADSDCHFSPDTGDCLVHHSVVWGGPFTGQDMTHASVPLPPGSYTFAMFNNDDAAAYQGWIDVRQGDESIISFLKEWRDSVSEQAHWVGYENRIRGNMESTDDEPFKQFLKELRKIEKLEQRIDRKVRAEIRKAEREHHYPDTPVVDADVLLTPGTMDYFRSATQPAYSYAELAAIREGTPVTKMLFVADSEKSKEKLNHVNDLYLMLKGRRAVLDEELKRLRHRKRYFALTDHIKHHDGAFVQNESRLQHVAGLLYRLDRRLAKLQDLRDALRFTYALSSPTENYDMFDTELMDLRGQLAVLQQKKHQVDLQFDSTPEESNRRISLERRRQEYLAAIDGIERQMYRLQDTKVAIANLRESTNIIHRENSARVLATVLPQDMPAHLSEALNREALMTIRLQASDSMFAPPGHDAVSARKTLADTVIDEDSN